jgi:catechol 2,3-dioxygenase-like lactoylglutathione lyase family enzyme
MRRLLRMIGLLIVVVFSAGCAQYSGAEVSATRVGCPNLSVALLDSSISFYTSVLDFKLKNIEDTSSTAQLAPGSPPALQARTAHLVLGDECLDITHYESPKGRPYPRDSWGNDLWFQHIAIVVSDMDKAYARVRDARVGFVSNVPQTLPLWNRQAAGIAAFYFRDPDGHYLELIHFPHGKGQPKWQGVSNKIFLGIDHTAIVVSDTRASVHFYHDNLHFQVTGSSENYGIEQEHLSGVFNAHVLITSLRSDSGIGIELLEYISPTSGRPVSDDLRLEDIVRWETAIEVSENGISSDEDEPFQKATWRDLPSEDHGHRKAAWVKDPDGHLLELIKPEKKDVK